LFELPPGAVIATGSLRRQAQIRHLRPDVQLVHIRGNVDTRLRKALAEDGPDAVILAAAGLKRLGLEGYITEMLPVETLVPAVGQGALAVEVRADDARLRRLARRIDHLPTRRAVLAERAVLATLGGGCQVPLGAHATVSADGETLRLLAVVASLDGTRLIRVEREGSARRPAALGQAVARELLRRGAGEIIREIVEPGGSEARA
jgi:hydroxymethylbilane synthase